MTTVELSAVSTMLVYAAMAAYAVALVAFAIDLSALGDRGPLGRRRRGAAIGMSTTVLAAAFHLTAVALRGLAAGRVPWANMYEFTIVFSLVAVLAFLAVSRRQDVRYLGALVVGPALLALGLAVTAFFVAAEGVQPALQSYWLVIHVSVATISVGVLSVAAGFSVLQLFRLRIEPAGASRLDDAGASADAAAFQEGGAEASTTPDAPTEAAPVGASVGDGAASIGQAHSPGHAQAQGPGQAQVKAQAQARARARAAAPIPTLARPAGGRLGTRAFGRVRSALPSAGELERLAYRLNAVGFVLWTFTLVAGAIWAEAAWGRYWGWDAKEVWTFVIWVVYAAYLHARSTRGWSGRRAAVFSLVGYTCVLLNFFVVNLLFTSLHTYSGL